jgi:hypothetical protein
VLLSGISSRALAPRSGRAGRSLAPPAERVYRPCAPPAGRGERPSAPPPDRACRARGPPAGRGGRPSVRSQVRLLERPPDPVGASGREPARRGPGRRWLTGRPAGGPSAALRAGRRAGLVFPRLAGERPLVGATGPSAASGRRDRAGSRPPLVPPRLVPPWARSPAGRAGRAADRVLRAPPGDSPPGDPYRRAALLVSWFCPAPVGRPAPPAPVRPAPVRPAPLRPAPLRPAPLRPATVPRPVPEPLGPDAAGRPVPVLRFALPPPLRPAPSVPFRVAPVRPLPWVPPRDGAWPAARGPARRVPPARSGRPVARPRPCPCSPVTLSSAPTTQFPDNKPRTTQSSGQHS